MKLKSGFSNRAMAKTSAGLPVVSVMVEEGWASGTGRGSWVPQGACGVAPITDWDQTNRGARRVELRTNPAFARRALDDTTAWNII